MRTRLNFYCFCEREAKPKGYFKATEFFTCRSFFNSFFVKNLMPVLILTFLCLWELQMASILRAGQSDMLLTSFSRRHFHSDIAEKFLLQKCESKLSKVSVVDRLNEFEKSCY